ncbi:MAG: FAD-dependent oxidoreductase [Candidatus Aminicenantes bacterium]|nr:FAD-dependent oxidoreductase [Candidatus Aminicenantes bacterium]
MVASLGLLAGCPGSGDDRPIYDLVIYGNTSAGVMAGVQARRDGLDVIVIGPDKHLGGLTAGGLGWTDSGDKEAIGGLSREFYQRVKAQYDKPETWKHQRPEEYSRYDPESDAMWVFEPHVAETVFEDMVAEAGLEVHRDKWLDRQKGVTVKKSRITEITMLDGTAYRSRVFIDATYEGDLMAAAGVSYAVGREPNSRYGETLNGVQTRNAVFHQFEHDISPYVVPDDPSSGLLPRIHDEGPGAEGSGDKKVQAYNFRMCLTTAEENRVPFPKPEGYEPLQYELLGRYLDAGWRGIWNKFDPAPNHKTDTNNHGAFSTDDIGMNHDYPEASYERRQEIVREHERYQKGLMWYLANDPRVPKDVRERMGRWGLARDEFEDNDHWPHQIYVREARRMVGDFVMTESHLTGRKPTVKSIGMGSYNMDSHHVQRYVDARGCARNEGDIEVNPGGPYLISYEAIIPRRKEVTNLLVPVCLSSSHIAYGSIRMEPVFMILGQSAAAAARIAVRQDIPVQDVDYDVLRLELLRLGQVLELRSGRDPSE